MTDFDQDQLFTNRVPVRVVVGLLHNDAFSGNIRRSPFAFEKLGLTVIRMTINGEEYPYKNALELVHNDGSKDMFGYRCLLESMASYKVGQAPLVLPDMWGQMAKLNNDGSAVAQPHGNVTLYAFNFTPDGLPERFFTIPDRKFEITSGQSMKKHDSMNVTCKFHHLRHFTEGIDRWKPLSRSRHG